MDSAATDLPRSAWSESVSCEACFDMAASDWSACAHSHGHRHGHGHRHSHSTQAYFGGD